MNEVSELSADVEALPVKAVAELLSVPVTRVHQHVRDGLYLSFRRDGVAHVPADFFDGTTVVKGLQGTIVVLRDGGFADPEILRWLFSEDDSLPGTPIASLREGRHREVKRRAQAMAF
ncbi:Rv2175c family DNA-binding protein [Pseudonocardia sp. CA-107938]|uniref:Rv2175c family DNA-binding protein n=1 Tax=Pseudonocardia sp. CA-107938 TaxID=3240021 RepID=UPI003D903ED6